MPDIDVPGRRAPYVVPMERAEGIHGHIVGLRQIPGDGVRVGEFVRPTWGLRDGHC